MRGLVAVARAVAVAVVAAVAAAVAVVAVVAVAGCSPPPQAPPSSGFDQYGCKIECDRCPAETLCVPAPYVPTCLLQCNTTADCDVGLKCAIITTDLAPPVCVGPASLTLCDPATPCTAAPECHNAMTQLKPLPSSFNACGWELIHCDSGCDAATGSCK